MKVASLNAKGLNDPPKLNSLWSWFFSLDIDILCLQEHKLHQYSTVQFYRGFTLCYGDIAASYSGTLTIARSSFSPSVSFNHSSRCCLGVSITSPFGPLLICNLYGFNDSPTRISLWQYLESLPVWAGMLCGDFNVVEHSSETSIGAAIMTQAEQVF